jgi:HupE / UreJ protein
MLLCLAFVGIAPAAVSHDSLPIVIDVRQITARDFTARLVVPPTVPEIALPGLMLGGCTGAQVGPSRDGRFRCEDASRGVEAVLGYRGARPANVPLLHVAWMDGRYSTSIGMAGAVSVIAAPPATAPAVAVQYLELGVRHILGGLDHLLFVACLMLVAGTSRRIVLVVTGFTLGHAVTVLLAARGSVALPAAAVEACIALSIVFVAAEVLRERRDTLFWRHPVLLAALFGLLHGLGFAGALSEVGLPPGQVAVAVLGFNLGIEAGQFAVVACVLLLVWCAGQWPAWRRLPMGRVQNTTAAAIGCLAGYWAVSRVAIAL